MPAPEPAPPRPLADQAALLALTMGDACGIGPETLVRAVAAGATGRALVVGDVAVMRRAVAQCGLRLPVARLDSPADALTAPPDCLAVWQPPGLLERCPGLANLAMGQIHADAGRAAALCIVAAPGLALRGEVAAIVTAPTHKAALAAAGVPFPGHTELLQALAGGAPVRMMLANDELRVVLVTPHVGRRRAMDLLVSGGVLQTRRTAHRSAAAWGQTAP
ncbi:MAG: 4-hydroxythreonine-4-phosphate dehydrogenase PdxA, partial [Microbacteriaceae bacterium]|nr:4-hydroxythreonine-4-phosphate dehydrogenase PdxA [Burkholderiaceae bacterium]